MSDSIWKTPDEIPAWCFLCVFDRPMGRSVGHYNPVKKQFCSGELRFEHKDIDKFCMIDDLITQANKAERLQKGIDLLFRQATVWSWQTAPTPDKKIVLSRRQIIGWLKKLKEITTGVE